MQSRRLILGAALAFTLPAPRKTQACPLTRTPPTASSRRPGFCVAKPGYLAGIFSRSRAALLGPDTS